MTKIIDSKVAEFDNDGWCWDMDKAPTDVDVLALSVRTCITLETGKKEEIYTCHYGYLKKYKNSYSVYVDDGGGYNSIDDIVAWAFAPKIPKVRKCKEH